MNRKKILVDIRLLTFEPAKTTGSGFFSKTYDYGSQMNIECLFSKTIDREYDKNPFYFSVGIKIQIDLEVLLPLKLYYHCYYFV